MRYEEKYDRRHLNQAATAENKNSAGRAEASASDQTLSDVWRIYTRIGTVRSIPIVVLAAVRRPSLRGDHDVIIIAMVPIDTRARPNVVLVVVVRAVMRTAIDLDAYALSKSDAMAGGDKGGCGDSE
jgi:hypothetical protein